MSEAAATKSRFSAKKGVLILGLVVLGAALLHSGRLSENDLIAFLILLASAVVHELAHAVIAHRLGDPTPKRAGRVALHPKVHIDPVGTVLVPAISILTGLGFIGWAKPVPLDPRHLKNPRNSSVVIALAGPVTNLFLVAIAYGGFKLSFQPASIDLNLGTRIFFYLGIVNLWLIFINLIPVPPLDGSKVLERFLPRPWWPRYLSVRHLLLPILLGVVVASTVLHIGLVSGINNWLYERWLAILGI